MAKQEWISVSTVLAELGITRSTLDGWRKNKVNPFPKFTRMPNGSLLLKRIDLETFMESLALV